MEGFLGYNRYYDTRYVCAADTTHARRFGGVAVSMLKSVCVFKSTSLCLACSVTLSSLTVRGYAIEEHVLFQASSVFIT